MQLYAPVLNPRLQPFVEHVQHGAADPQNQRFHHISADLTDPGASVRIIAEITAWNHGQPPDIVWCIAGAARPSVFVDAPVEDLRNQMDTNYFTSAYMAHAVLNAWLKPAASTSSSPEPSTKRPTPRHLVFTSSFLGLFPFAGYGPYTPAKCALRALADTLAQEMHLYAGARPDEPAVRLHTVFPATIYGAGLDAENRHKPGITKKLEEGDPGQTADEVARVSVAGLEHGDALVPTSFLTRLVMCGALGGSVRNGWGVVDTALSWVMNIVLPIVRWDMDKKVRAWGAAHGPSGMKKST